MILVVFRSELLYNCFIHVSVSMHVIEVYAADFGKVILQRVVDLFTLFCVQGYSGFAPDQVWSFEIGYVGYRSFSL